ncbi:hypothetical protein [Halorarum halobium]|uniref:hypothetical protein n=1 Tax=Halorarum halobium TaxID=3075121 RepID=UPI0028AFCEA0|nr:hypothetical protein [Halobaculum sp. XH14]
MALNEFDQDQMEHFEWISDELYDSLESGEDVEIRVRPGYDDAPRQYDLQRILDPRMERFQESSSEAVDDLYEFVDDFFGETQYVDWTTVAFDELEQRGEEFFEYDDGSELHIEVYEPREDGHDILRL